MENLLENLPMENLPSDISLQIIAEVAWLKLENEDITRTEIVKKLKKKFGIMLSPLPSSNSVAQASDTDSTDQSLNKKRKKAISSNPRQELPPAGLMEKIKSEEIGGEDPTLILSKEIMASDLDKNQNRLSMPINQLMWYGFLDEAEEVQAEKKSGTGRKRIEGLQVSVIEPCLETATMAFKRWELKLSSSYVLTTTWHDVSARNNLQLGQMIQVWFFRDRHQKPWFALVNLG